MTLNACGDRHCPDCARQSRYLWHQDVLSWSLNCDYLHLVTTLPHELNDLIVVNRALLLRLLFDCTRKALLKLIWDRYRVVPGLIMVLHTWGQRLNFHFHAHIVMTAGGLSKDLSNDRWIHFDQDAMEASGAEIAGRFKAMYMRGLRKLIRKGKLRLPDSVADERALERMLSVIEGKDWMVNVGATPKKYRDSGQRRMSLGYVGKYVAGTAIGDGRMISDEGGIVTFRSFDYRTEESIEIQMLGERFVEAFAGHFLPIRMRRCRMAGIFAPQGRTERLDRCRVLLGEPTKKQMVEAEDESMPNSFCGDEDDKEEEEGSYVPCPVCREKTRFCFELDGEMVCELMRVAVAACALLLSGAAESIGEAVKRIARAGCHDRPLLRTLVPGRFETYTDLILTTETLVGERLRRHHDDTKPTRATERGPPGQVA